MNELFERIDELAREPVLLVATDYDGTLAPIVDDPAAALPHREALVALARLAALPDTHVAVISGRALAELARFTGNPDGLRLVGSHGSEFDVGFASSLNEAERALRSELLSELERITQLGPGLSVEPKPAGAAFHWRRAAPGLQETARDAVLQGPAARDGVHVMSGKCVLELSVVSTDKGQALERLRHGAGAQVAIYLGDDVTDEDAFARLHGRDVGVKVGDGETMAGFRVADPSDVARVLARLGEARRAWLRGPATVPIEAHSLLSDQRTAALVTPDARVVWYCAPRIDSPALFAELLGGRSAGYFSVASVDGSAPLRQTYEGATMVLRTRWKHFSVVDYLDCSQGRPRQRAGRTDLLRVLEGNGRVAVEFAPRLDFGRSPTRLRAVEGGLEVVDAFDGILLRSPGVEWTIEPDGQHQTARAEVELGQAPLVLELSYGGGARGQATAERARRRSTHLFWSDWADGLRLPSVATDAVRRSALVLKSLCYGPTGAILAAPTTSLPEHVGGIRNWDYRYTWLRDAALSAHALVELGSLSEGMDYLDWVLSVVEELDGPQQLRPLYDVTGRDLGPEAEIRELCGYAGSRPVRVGNAAAAQVQLDVFGPIADLVLALARAGAPLASSHWRLVEALVLAVERRWAQPDHGIWEIRAAPRHHVHSKTMCWVTVDRAIALARDHFHKDVGEWPALRDRIRDEILERGYKPSRGAFTAAYEGDDLDAATLLLGTCGLIDCGDERFVRTVDAIEAELRAGATVYRYRSNDGLAGTEGGFHILAAWLTDALLETGRGERAEQLFEALLDCCGPTGLLSEQLDPETGRALGNHPQAYSHLGLIFNAVRLARHGRGGRR
ncbi:trehalose-phosphatase [Engelhardtia mirabilis]|uniref:Trehalase n=1 Tax=Engelhardtia mirabilis TaxID=2528011 RepID=A0A518BKV6_9BACT|nr:Trehalase [Planctomycetes bacterium Pla133]QDV01930.1 Trehalase [Planctomycetes bacterium Pla86]